MSGGREADRQGATPGGPDWTPDELVAMKGLEEFLADTAETAPVTAGVAEVIFARDRDAVLAAVERHPELLTDRGDAAFRLAVMMTEMTSPGRLADTVRRAQASVQAIREARA